MARVNRKVIHQEFNHEGTPVPSLTPLQQLERSVMSCLLWENEFYEDGQTIADRIKDLVAKCSPTDVAMLAVRAKRDMRLRHVPLLLTRELCRSKEGRKEMERILPGVINRVDDITELLAMYMLQKEAPRKPAKLPNQLKKHLGLQFRKFDEYQLGKYNGGKKEVSLKDAIKLTHPVPANAEQSALWKRVIKDELSTPDTWEVELSASKDKKASWERLLSEKKLGGLAMLRNIRNMRQAGIADELIREGISSIDAGRLLPINFITAANHNPQFENEIEEKFLQCFSKEKLTGKTIVLVDISPSMNAKLSGRSELKRTDVACSLAMIAREMFKDIEIYSFSNERALVPNRKGFALREAILRSQPSNGTMLGQALKNLPAHDRLIVITDEESQDAVPQMKGYMINVASTRNGIGYHQWTHIDGWSDKVLSYIVATENVRG